MRLFDLMVAGSIGAAIAGCALDESGLIASPDGAPQADVRVDAPLGHDATRPDASAADARKDAPHAMDSKCGETGSGETGGGDAGDAGSCPTPVDCSNAACKAQGYVCTPPAPAGWSMAAVDFTSAVPCPPGYGAGVTVATAPTGGPAACGCSCSPGVSPSCTTGIIDGASGVTGCTGGYAFDTADGVCTPTVATFVGYGQVLGTPGALGGTCTGTPSETVPPSGSTSAYVCPAMGPASSNGCSGGEVCVAVGSTESQCIVQPGASSCSGAYSVQHAVGASVSDTRSCAGLCTCGAPSATCDNQTWTFYTGTGCKGTANAVDMNGSCDTYPVSSTVYYSYQYTADPAGVTCGTALTTPAPSGMVSLLGPRTLCCLP